MPQQVFIESRNQTIEFPDDATQEEIDSFVAAEFPRTGKDVAYDLSKFSDVADMRDFIAMMPDEDYVKLNNYKADEKLSWGELAGIAGEALGTIVGDAVKGVGSAVTRAGDGVMESAARGVGAGTIDLVNLGQKLITPNERIPSLEEFMQTPRTQFGYAYGPGSPSAQQVAPSVQDYQNLINQQRTVELQSLDLAEASEKLIKGAPIEEVARGASYLDAITLAGLGKSIAKAGLRSIYKKTAQAPIEIVAKASPEMVAKVGPEIIDNAAKATIESRQSFIPANMMRNAEAFAQKVGEGAKKAGFTGVELGAKTVEKTADIGKGIINVANKLGLENAALRGTIGGAIGYQDGGTSGAITGTLIGSAAPVIARKGLGLVSGTADFIGAAAKAAKSGPSRVGIFEKMAQAADISPEARQFAEKVLFAQPFMQAAGEVARQTAIRSLIGVPVGAALGYATDGERGAAAGAGSGLAVSGLSGTLATAIDTIKSIAGKSTARSQRNAMGDIRSFVNNIPDDVARTGYAEFMDKAIQVAGPERAADMLDHLRLAEGMGATVEVVPPSKRKDAFNAFDYSGQGGGKIIINPDRLTPGSVAHETFHQLLHVGVKTELGNALREVYMPQRDADGNIIKQGLFDDAEFAKRAAQLANEYKNNPEGYRMALDYANKLKDPAGVSPEALDEARMFVIDEMTAEYSENFMGRGRPGVFNPDRLPLWHRNLLRQIDDKILNTITDKIYADKNIKGPNTPFFTDENGKPVRVPQLDKILNRAFANKMARDRGQTAGKMGRPSEVVIPTKPRDLVAFAQATFGATRDILGTDEKGNPYVLTDKERKATTAADFEAAKEAFQSLPQEAKATVQVTNKTGQPVDINSKSAQIRITQQTPNDVFEAFLRVAKERGMGNQQIANMRQIYQAITAEEGPTFNTVNNPVYKFNARTGGMRAEVRPPTRQEVYPLGIRINSAGGFNVDYIDMSRVKANAQKILDNPNYKGIWDGMDDFMSDFKRSLKNLSDQNAIPSAELLGKGNEKIGAVKRDLIAEAMNVTLPKRLEYTNQPVIDPLTLLTSEGKERRVGGSAIRDFRIERLTEVIPTDERMKVVQENFYDRLVSRFQPSAFVREALPNGETLTNPDGYRILKKTGGKLFRVYDDNGALLGTSSSEDAAMKKAQSDYAKKVEKEEPASTKRFQPDAAYRTAIQSGDSGTDNLGMLIQAAPAAERANVIEQWMQRNPQSAAAVQRMVEEAAKKAGYNSPKLFHGTGAEFTIFDKKRGGSSTEAQSAKIAFFFTDDEATAKAYAIYAAEEGPVKAALKKAELAEKRGDWNAYDAAIQEAESLENYEATLKRRESAKVVSTYLRGDFLEFDAKGQTPQELSDGDIDKGITNQLRKAQRAGKAGVLFKNLDDAVNLSNRPSNHYAVFDPNQIKSADPITYDDAGNIIPPSQRFNVESPDIRFQPDSASPSILNGSNGTRIIKSPSGKFRVYSAAGTLLGIRDTEEAAKKLATK